MASVLDREVVDLYKQDNANGFNWNWPVSPMLIEIEPVSPTSVVIFEWRVYEWRASFTRLDTESTFGKYALTSGLQDMSVWPYIQDEGY